MYMACFVSSRAVINLAIYRIFVCGLDSFEDDKSSGCRFYGQCIFCRYTWLIAAHGKSEEKIFCQTWGSPALGEPQSRKTKQIYSMLLCLRSLYCCQCLTKEPLPNEPCGNYLCSDPFWQASKEGSLLSRPPHIKVLFHLFAI